MQTQPQITGMTSRNFKGFPSLKEVQCSGRALKPDLKLLSLQLYRVPKEEMIASLVVFSNTCVTMGDYSSCVVNTGDTHVSTLRTLVTDMREGERRQYKCTASAMDSYGLSKHFTRTITIQVHSKYWQNSEICDDIFSCPLPSTRLPTEYFHLHASQT